MIYDATAVRADYPRTQDSGLVHSGKKKTKKKETQKETEEEEAPAIIFKSKGSTYIQSVVVAVVYMVDSRRRGGHVPLCLNAKKEHFKNWRIAL